MPEETSQIAALEAKGDILHVKVGKLEIGDQPTYEVAAEMLQGVKALRKEVSKTFDPICQKAKATHTEACNQRTKHDDPLKRAEHSLKMKMSGYLEAEARTRREEEAKLAAEARRVEEDRRLAEAQALEEADEPEAASAVLEEELYVPPPVVPPPVKVRGTSARKRWTGACSDFPELVRAIAKGSAPISLLKLNEGELNRLGQSTEGQLKLPGVEWSCGTVIASRAT